MIRKLIKKILSMFHVEHETEVKPNEEKQTEMAEKMITKIGEKGLELLKKYEGCKLVAYKAHESEKYYTIGYGHYSADVKKGQIISIAEAEDLLKQDVKTFERVVYSTVGNVVNQNQFDALVCFAYNVGATAFKNSTLAKKVVANANDKTIAGEFAKWNKCNGNVLEGLNKRRTAESKLYFS